MRRVKTLWLREERAFMLVLPTERMRAAFSISVPMVPLSDTFTRVRLCTSTVPSLSRCADSVAWWLDDSSRNRSFND